MQTSLFERVRAALQHQWLLVVCIIGLGFVAAAFAAVHVHSKYTATSTVLMVAEPPESANPHVPVTATKPLLSMDLPSLATDATVLSRFRDDLGETVTFETLRARIHAKVNPDSTIMPVMYTVGSADAAVRGANVLADEITRFYRETATKRFDSLIADFNAQLATRRAELAKLDSDVASTAKSYPYIDTTTTASSNGGATSVYQRLIALRTSRDELQATMLADGAAARATNRLIVDAKPLAERDIVNSDSAYRNVRDQYAKDYAALKRMNAYGSDRYPGVVELRETVAREARTVAAARYHAVSAGPAANGAYVAALDAQAKADALYASDRARYDAQSAQLLRLESQLGLRSISSNAARLHRDHDNAEAAYALIAARLAKAIADRAEAASTGSVIVLDRAAFAPKASYAGSTVVATGVIFLAVWLALSVAVMTDGSQEWFRDARTVEVVYSAKLIGSLA